MGALHEGHLTLVRRSIKENDITVVSIFVNPTQFDQKEDFDHYPREMTQDLKMLEDEGVSVVFTPEAEDMYRSKSLMSVEPGPLNLKLCGMSRQNHFRGVLTVVLKLFNIVKPQIAYFGQKDYQQFLMISEMVNEFNLDVELRMCEIVREEDGLAMSSRNQRLNAEQREEAAAIYQSLEMGLKKFKKGETQALKVAGEMMESLIENTLIDIDYLAVVNPFDLEDLETVDMQQPFLIAIAAFVGPVRLIDNILYKPTP